MTFLRIFAPVFDSQLRTSLRRAPPSYLYKRRKSKKTPKTSILTFIDDGEKRIPIKTISAAQAIKKLNYENENLFGPIVKSTAKKRKELQMGLSYLDFKIPRRYKERKEKNTNLSRKITITEHGFKDLPTPDYADNILLPMHEELKTKFVPAESADLSKLGNTEISDISKEITIDIPNQDLDLKEVLKFPLLNSFRESKIDSEDHHYIGLQNETVDCNKYPSVTSILNRTMDPISLEKLRKWKEWMIKKLGEDGFKRYQEQLLSQGKSFHKSIQDLLSGVALESVLVEPANEGHWESLQAIIPDLSEVQCLETKVVHPYLQYKGVVDCVATYRDKVVLIDWKTSKKLKPKLSDTYDNPLQIAAYMGAFNFDTNYQIQVKEALIVIAYEDGSPCHIHEMGPIVCEQSWRRWLQKVKLYWELASRSENSKSTTEEVTNLLFV